ncbi:hypothetical protein [Leeia sp.]|uniref:hypothetical protein n=1 Tax=Leeia sp. TaxID=2884678 RepID=UPI0035B10FC6
MWSRRARFLPFEHWPRHRRSEAVIQLKNRMRRYAADYGGRFDSLFALDEPEPAAAGCSWFDFYFPGSNRFTLWNTSLVTARAAFQEEAGRLAREQAYAALTAAEREAEQQIEFIPALFSDTGKVWAYEAVSPPEPHYARFEGRTLHQQMMKLKADILLHTPPVIHECFQIQPGYRYGVGLKMVLDVDVIDRAVVEYAIDRFLAVGECNWRSAQPVPLDRLRALDERA